PTDNLFFKFGQWYSVLLGGFWPVAILGNILIFIYPNLPNTKLIQNIKSGNKMLEDMTKKDVIKIRVEVLIIILFWSSLIYFLQIDIFNFFLLFAAGGFNWSTRQYITHAFSKRSVWDGAINLKTNIIQEKLLLNGNWDLEHHLFPYLPWTYLKKSGKIKGTERNYLSQYFSMWGGPIPNHQSAPSPISREEYFKNRMSDSITTDNI
ncbi:MAG: fatty acid desaturase, partial [Leptospiraceae bacterium]|nr:fatty acid desaturase [Leptospiraceae bacterium]